MKIKKIILNNYKRFHHLTIDLGDKPKRIVALVGENGCGKSSIFDGMLFKNSAHFFVGNAVSKSNVYHSMNRNQNISHKNIDIQFESGAYEECYAKYTAPS